MKLLCFFILIVQIIYVSNDYFSYPFGIKVYIDYGDKISLPSITLCTERDFIWSKRKLDHLKSGFETEIIQHFDPQKHCIKALYLGLKLNNSEEKQCEKINFEKKSNLIFNKIINSNDPNISLKNIFANTLSADQFIDCRINYKVLKDKYREIDCRAKSRVIEMFEKTNRFGKCFVFFNRKQLINDSIEKIDLSRNDYIELKIYRHNVYEIKSNISYSEKIYDNRKWSNYGMNSIYSSIHSSNSSTTISNFNGMQFIKSNKMDPLNINVGHVITFNKIIYKKLTKPYSTECQEFSQDSEFYSYRDCYEFCSLKRTISVNNCVPNPIENNFFDLKNNSDFQNNILCDTTHVKRKNNKICKTKCTRNCFEDYYNSKIESYRHIKDFYNKIQIEARNHPVYVYEAYPKYSFIIYLTHIGGLMSLWFGVSAIDLHKLIKLIVQFLNISLNGLIILIENNVYLLRIYLYLNQMANILRKLRRFEWHKLMKLICIFCYLYQLYELTTEYLTYGSTVHVQFSNYNDSFGHLKAENIPGVSICDHNFLKSFPAMYVTKDINVEYNRLGFRLLLNHFDSKKNSKNFSCIQECKSSDWFNDLKCYNQITKMIDEERNISNYLTLLSFIPLKLKCYQYFRDSYITECFEKEDIVFSKSYLGNCITYLSNLTKKEINYMNIENSTVLKIFDGIIKNNKYQFWLSIHDQNQLPSFGFNQMIRARNFEYTLTKVIRLPHPFSTNCFDYKNSYHVKSRQQCINQCLINKSIKNKGCVPKNFEYLTFSNIDLWNAKFCENSSFENNLKTECKNDCHLACEESLFNIESNKEHLSPSKQRYITYVDKELMTITYYLSTIGGLLGLWNNLSIYDLQVFLTHFLRKFLDSAIIQRLSIYIFSIKWFRLSRAKSELFFNFLVQKVKFKVRILMFQRF